MQSVARDLQLLVRLCSISNPHLSNFRFLLLCPAPGKAASGNWSATGSMATARLRSDGHPATQRQSVGGRVPGHDHHSPPEQLNSAVIYDPTAGTWSVTGSMGADREDFTATLLPNGKVLVAGGFSNSSFSNSAELYDPATGTWSVTGALARGRTGHTATLLPNGKVLVAGGFWGGGLTSPRAL